MFQSKPLHRKFEVLHNEYNWKSEDGQELFAQCWDAGPDALAGILLVHGMGEHSSRYDKWATRLAEDGFSVLSFDLRGHGKTPGIRGSASNYNVLLKDIDFLIEKGNVLCREKPLFLYGHSFGGNLVINYAISRTIKLAGIIVTSPWLELAHMPPRHKVMAAKILHRFAPGIISKSGLRAEHISRELREVHNYRTDPYIHSNISVGLYMQTYEYGLIAKRSIYKINVPLLVMHGSADNITSFKASRDFVMNSGDKTTFIEIEGGYHELHNDSDREKVFTHITDWLNSQISK
jgi:acylglycerol lipase